MKTSSVILVLMVVILGGILVYSLAQPNRNEEPNTIPNGPASNGSEEQDGSVAQDRTVTLYYYDESKDKDSQGNIMCSDRGLVGVTRTIPATNTPIQDVIRLLLKGELSQQEKAQGISTEFPLAGVELVGANLVNGVLTLELQDPNNRTTGGSCRVSILAGQIQKTAMQFDGVERVVFKPDELFQP